ncbi:MAG TPA: glycine betaine ABC transporter substrate-binding protein [Bryobacteraceae bacterium]|nr:glycine betaine ABC transporter substrate-binding protein [Bryobacteraceae bacterium]
MDRTALLSGLIAALLLAGCTRTRHVVVGSKNFTEQLVLGEIIAQHIEDRLHQPVERKLDLGGTLLAHQALLAKDIDLYPEYTGTAFTNVLKLTGVNDPAVVLERVRTEYAARFHLDWLDPLGFDSSFAMTVRGADARARHLETLSDAAADRAGFSLGAGYEFLTRPDGLAALNAAYPIHWTAPPKSMDLGLLYQALTANQVSMVAANTTDGLLSKLDVRVLADDKHAFPPYQACIAVRSDALAAFPGLRGALVELSGRISADAMQKMNYAVEVEHRPVPDVAKEFLRNAGLR